MSIIEKLEETWTSGSITTLFRLLGSVTAISTSLPLQSPVAGFSWRLIVKRSQIPPVLQSPVYGAQNPFGNQPSGNQASAGCQLLFDSHNCPGAWRGTPVNVTVSFPSHPGDTSLCTTSISAILGGGNIHTEGSLLLITCPVDKLGDALVSLKVTFTNPLTRNLFDVLAHVGPIPDVPTSAEEPRVPQACSALRALDQSFKTGTSFDIIFQAYTRRFSPGKVTRPIPIYASIAVLQTTTLLPDFSEEGQDFSSLFELSDGDTFPFTSPESYEYESDSDLDDDEGNDLTVVQPIVDSAPSDEAPGRHGQRSHTPNKNDPSYEGATDSGSISSFSSIEAGLQEEPDNRTLLSEDIETVPAATNENVKRGSRVVLIKGVAWRTWHTFIYYCYTGIVNFANLRSQGVDVALQQSRLTHGPPHCSPKSMYQLATKLRNEPLSQLSLTAIETRLSAANILDEAFSKFTSRHDAIREMEIAQLVKHRNASEVLQSLPTKIMAMAMGNTPHAAPVFTTYCQQITQISNSNNQNKPNPESNNQTDLIPNPTNLIPNPKPPHSNGKSPEPRGNSMRRRAARTTDPRTTNLL
ncbi:uncharacterized protein EDB91DRAFT_1341432 [Suillus paluster]|uniref:uncharacterized protein n=1 Tax=Suillus paluster TaxID=48578 RepID=UPI001B85BA91|nr:uncharacterized protein EDB91DRAFT_1341432 [Suillus paluster]KAG1718206.1 hypothetical protein EDB91DRAFT_1341432 [Suillus paluster]